MQKRPDAIPESEEKVVLGEYGLKLKRLLTTSTKWFKTFKTTLDL